MFKFNQATAQKQFWDWFSEHSETYFEFEKKQESLFNELTQALDQVQPGLAFEFGPKENGVRDFVISADRNRELFLPVTQLVQAAPPLKQWNVVAFRQRREAECEILINDVVMTTAKIFFKLEPDGDKTGITLFFTDYKSMRERTLLTAAFLLIDNALGEYDVETKVGFIERQHLQECEKSRLSFALQGTADGIRYILCKLPQLTKSRTPNTLNEYSTCGFSFVRRKITRQRRL